MRIVAFTAAAALDLDRLAVQDREAVPQGLTELAVTRLGNVKRLSGRAEFQLRIRQFRVIFAEDRTTILALYIGRRETTTYRRR